MGGPLGQLAPPALLSQIGPQSDLANTGHCQVYLGQCCLSAQNLFHLDSEAPGSHKKSNTKKNTGFPGGANGKESACQYRRSEFDPGPGRSSGVGNVNPSRIFAWEIPWTEEPGRLQFMGSEGVRHDWVHTHKENMHC